MSDYLYTDIGASFAVTQVLLIIEHGSRLRLTTADMSRDTAEQDPKALLEMYITIADRFESLIREGKTVTEAINGVLNERLLENFNRIPNKAKALVHLSRAVKRGSF